MFTAPRGVLGLALLGLAVILDSCHSPRGATSETHATGDFITLPGCTDVLLGTPLDAGNDEYHAEESPRRVDVSSFAVARCLISAEEFCAFLNSPHSEAAKIDVLWCDDASRDAPFGTITRVDRHFVPRPGADRAPANRVTWIGATEYCKWRSRIDAHFNYRLLTDNEWEYMARGRNGRLWPWGEQVPDASRGYRWTRKTIASGSTWITCAVGTFTAGATPEGVLDVLCFPLYEWCGDDTTEVQAWATVLPWRTEAPPEDHLQCARGHYMKERERLGFLDALLSNMWHESRTWSRFAVPGKRAACTAGCGFRVVRMPK